MNVRAASERLLLDQIARAKELGHDIDGPLTRPKVSGSKIGYGVRCSCGWETTPSSKRLSAIAKAMVHVGLVVGEDGTPATPAPAAGAEPTTPELPVAQAL